MTRKNMTLPEFLTEAQIEAALKLYKETPTEKLNKALREQILEPNMEEINRKLGQENDPAYLAYAIEYVFNSASGT